MHAERREYSVQASIGTLNRAAIILLAGSLAGCARFESQPISPAHNAANEPRHQTNPAETSPSTETVLGRVSSAVPRAPEDSVIDVTVPAHAAG